MKTEVKKSSLAILVMQRNLLFFLSLLLLCSTLSLSVVSLRNQSITLFKPPESILDLKGVQAQGEFLAHLILNRNPSVAEEQNQTLFPWVDPPYLFALKEGLSAQTQDMKENQTSFEWILLDTAIEKLDNNHARLYLQGTLSLYLPIQDGKKQLIEQENAQYILDLKLKNGKLLLTHFRKVEPHA